jgi:hypothetical protein
MTQLRLAPYTLMGAPIGAENPLPVFRNPDPDYPFPLLDSVPPGKREWAGWQAGFRVLPYRMQDNYTRERTQMTFRAVVLENEHLRATFLPEVGGRLVSLVRLPGGRELLSRNPVFQPANTGTLSLPARPCLPQKSAVRPASRVCGCTSTSAAKGCSGTSISISRLVPAS